MDEYREFISTFRELELNDVYFLLHENLTPTFTKYVKMIRDLKFVDGTYQTYYFDLKKIITSFFSYYNEKIDKTIKDVDRYTHIVTIGTVVELCNKTIDKYTKKQQNFEFEFLPVQSQAEKECYERIKKKMATYVVKLNEMSQAVQKLDKQFKVDLLARKIFPKSIKGDYEKFKYTHLFLARMLATRITFIDTSISEMNIRVCQVFKKYQSNCEEAIHSLLHQLYNVNKESLRLQRRDRRCSIDHEKVNTTILLIREKIDKHNPHDTALLRLEEEIQHWTRKSQEIDYIATALAYIKSDQKHLINLEQKSLLMDGYCSCFPEKLDVISEETEMSIEEIRNKQHELNKEYDEVSRCLFTFFCVRGSNLIYYRDNIGQYYIDEYGHKVYSFEHGLELCHMCRDGTFQDLQDVEKRYFNEYGTYVYEEYIENASVMSMTLSLSSSQESFFLDASDDALAERKSLIGKSKERLDRKTELGVIDTRNKLDEGSVKYLWDVFGSILPVALFDVYASNSKNPIHCLAYNLLKHKYGKCSRDLKINEKEAEKYRTKQYNDAHVKARAEALAWKSKMPKRNINAEIYENDIQNLFLGASTAQHDFIMGSHFTY